MGGVGRMIGGVLNRNKIIERRNIMFWVVIPYRKHDNIYFNIAKVFILFLNQQINGQ